VQITDRPARGKRSPFPNQEIPTEKGVGANPGQSVRHGPATLAFGTARDVISSPIGFPWVVLSDDGDFCATNAFKCPIWERIDGQ